MATPASSRPKAAVETGRWGQADVDPQLLIGQLEHMRSITVIAVALFAASSTGASVRATVTPQELAAAINKADAQLVPYRKSNMSPGDIRAVRCTAPDEEPTEFECKWQQHIERGWVNRTTWLAIDGNGWHVMDA